MDKEYDRKLRDIHVHLSVSLSIDNGIIPFISAHTNVKIKKKEQ